MECRTDGHPNLGIHKFWGFWWKTKLLKDPVLVGPIQGRQSMYLANGIIQAAAHRNSTGQDTSSGISSLPKALHIHSVVSGFWRGSQDREELSSWIFVNQYFHNMYGCPGAYQINITPSSTLPGTSEARSTTIIPPLLLSTIIQFQRVT